MVYKICYIVGVSAFILMSLISLIVIAAKGSGRGAKITFCILSALGLIAGIIFVLIWRNVLTFDFIEQFRGNPYVVYLAIALLAVSASEFTGMLCLLKNSKKPLASAPLCVEVKEYPLPGNVRKKDERLHGEYKIVDMGE